MKAKFAIVLVVLFVFVSVVSVDAGSQSRGQKTIGVEDSSVGGQIKRLGSVDQNLTTTTGILNLYDMMKKGYVDDGQTYEQIVAQAIANQPKKVVANGFVIGSDPNILAGLQRRAEAAKISPKIKLEYYFSVSLKRGEVGEIKFSVTKPFAIFIPAGTEQYVVEISYEKDGVVVKSDIGVAESASFVRGPNQGQILRVTVTRAPNFD